MTEQEYLDRLTEQIRCKKAKGYVAQEVKDHIEDQVSAYKRNGLTDAEAVEAAVQEMGDPIEAGVELDRVHRPKMEWRFLVFIICLSVLSMGIHFFLKSTAASMQIAATLIGILVMMGICYLDYSILARYANVITVGFLLLFVIAFTLFPHMENGAVRQAGVGEVTISLWFLLQIYPPIYGAFLYAQRRKRWGFLKAIICLIIPVFYAGYMPIISLAISMEFVLLVILSIAVAKGWFVQHKKAWLGIMWGTVTVVPASLIGTLYALGRLSTFRAERLKSYFHPKLFSAFTVSTSSSHMDYQSSTGYMLSFLASYYGIIAAILIVMLLTFMIGKIFHISCRQKNQLGMITGVSCGLVFALQTVSYILLNVGLIRTTDVYLPLFSGSRSGTIVSYFLLGIVLSIYRYQDVLPLSIQRKKWSRLEAIRRKNILE